VAVEERGGFIPGQVIPERLAQKITRLLGDRGLCELPGGTVLAVGHSGSVVAVTPRGTMPQKPEPPADILGGGDLRTLPVRYNANGERFRSITDAVTKFSSTSFADWKIKGPRTANWPLEQMALQGDTPLQRHFWWRSILRLQAGDHGVDDHYFLSELFEFACSYDQLNIGELLIFEAIARRYQLWEETYSAALQAAEAGPEGSDWLDERHIFLGNERSRGHALVAPELEQWVATRLQAESAVLKERRKGREERLLARGVDINTPGATGGGQQQQGGGRGNGRGRGAK